MISKKTQSLLTVNQHCLNESDRIQISDRNQIKIRSLLQEACSRVHGVLALNPVALNSNFTSSMVLDLQTTPWCEGGMSFNRGKGMVTCSQFV